MATTKCDWAHWHAVFQEVHQTGNLSLADFCRAENLPYGATQKAFRRLEMAREKNFHKKGKTGQTARTSASAKWEALRLDFLEGPWNTLRDFARDKNLNAATGYFARQTRGWLAEKAKIREQGRAESVAAIADSKGAEAIGALHGRILTALYACLSDLETNGPVRGAIGPAIDSAKDSLDLMRNVGVVVDALLKIEPAVGRIEGLVGARGILKGLAEQKIDVTGACLAFEEMGISLPETLRIMLAKQEPPEPPAVENEIPSDEELERRWREGLDKIHEQTERFLPERQKEIEQLKEECKDCESFMDAA